MPAHLFHGEILNATGVTRWLKYFSGRAQIAPPNGVKCNVFSVSIHPTTDIIINIEKKNIAWFRLSGLTSSLCECIRELKCEWRCTWAGDGERVSDKRPTLAPDWEDGPLWPHWSKSLSGSPCRSIRGEVGNSSAAVWTTAHAISALSVPVSFFTCFHPPNSPRSLKTSKYLLGSAPVSWACCGKVVIFSFFL